MKQPKNIAQWLEQQFANGGRILRGFDNLITYLIEQKQLTSEQAAEIKNIIKKSPRQRKAL